MSKIIKKIMNANQEYTVLGSGGSEGEAHEFITQADYDLLTPAQQAEKVYMITGEGETPTPVGPVEADSVEYDNTNSGLTATNVQDAIDEVNGDIDNLKNSTVINTPDTTAPTLSGLTYTLNADGIYLIEIENAHSLRTDVVLNINGETIATVSGSNGTLCRLSMTLFDGKTGDTISVNITPVVSSHGYFTVQKINRIYSLVNNYN